MTRLIVKYFILPKRWRIPSCQKHVLFFLLYKKFYHLTDCSRMRYNERKILDFVSSENNIILPSPIDPGKNNQRHLEAKSPFLSDTPKWTNEFQSQINTPWIVLSEIKTKKDNTGWCPRLRFCYRRVLK